MPSPMQSHPKTFAQHPRGQWPYMGQRVTGHSLSGTIKPVHVAQLPVGPVQGRKGLPEQLHHVPRVCKGLILQQPAIASFSLHFRGAMLE